MESTKQDMLDAFDELTDSIRKLEVELSSTGLPGFTVQAPEVPGEAIHYGKCPGANQRQLYVDFEPDGQPMPLCNCSVELRITCLEVLRTKLLPAVQYAYRGWTTGSLNAAKAGRHLADEIQHFIAEQESEP